MRDGIVTSFLLVFAKRGSDSPARRGGKRPNVFPVLTADCFLPTLSLLLFLLLSTFCMLRSVFCLLSSIFFPSYNFFPLLLPPVLLITKIQGVQSK